MKTFSQRAKSDCLTEQQASRGAGWLALLYLALYFALLQFRMPGANWNWSGKMAAIGFSCMLLVCSPWLRRNVGFCIRQASGSLRLSLMCTLVGIGIATGLTKYFAPSTPFSAETLLFQAIMPGLDEELAFRGIALALLERAFGQSPMSCRLRLGSAGFILSMFFGLQHAVSFTRTGIGFDYRPFVIMTAFACVASLIRTRSGSLLWSILFHSGWNVSYTLTAMSN